MKWWKLFIKDIYPWLLLHLSVMVISMALLVFNHVPLSEIWYALILNFFVAVISVGYMGYRWNKRKKLLDELLVLEPKTTAEHTIRVLDSFGGTDSIYASIISDCIEEGIAYRNEAQNKQCDLQEYYTMWAHQIKTPIAGLKLLLEQDIEKPHTDELAELSRIEQYVDMVLQYARIDADDTDFVIEKVELEQVLRLQVRKFARIFISKNISLDFGENRETVLTDGKWIGFVIEQLLSNAVKYTKDGRVGINSEVRGNQTVLIIEDTGIGIRAEDLPRIMEKGYTGYNGHLTKQSTGIGLYLCNKIINKLGHKLVITSEQGKGTRAEIIF